MDTYAQKQMLGQLQQTINQQNDLIRDLRKEVTILNQRVNDWTAVTQNSPSDAKQKQPQSQLFILPKDSADQEGKNVVDQVTTVMENNN